MSSNKKHENSTSTFSDENQPEKKQKFDDELLGNFFYCVRKIFI